MTTTRVPAARLAPDWLLATDVALCPCGCIGKRRKGGYLAKTLTGVANVVRRAVFSDDVATAPGVLQQIDARVKVLALFGVLIVAAFLHTIPVLGAMYLGVVVLALANRVPLGMFIARVWLFVPIFTGVVVLPATLSLITPGEIVVPLGTWFGTAVGLTAEGLESAGLIVTRAALSISLVVLLTLTTQWSRLLAALRSIFVPTTVILVLSMSYRYLFHLLTSVDDMYTARRARTVGAESGVASSRRFVAASAGALFGKAHAMSEEVYLAMVSRGYTGNVCSLTPPRVRRRDALFGAVCVLVALLVLWGDHAIR